jgi:hypothetical protein
MYDAPCESVFGMCGKRTADGGLRVVMQTESIGDAYVKGKT